MASSASDHLSKDLEETDSDDFAKVWAALSKGEKTAEALESNLTNLEKKIDDLLASFEESERKKVEEVDGEDLKKEEVTPKPKDLKASKTGETPSTNGENSKSSSSTLGE
ncbi:hypothetical protein BGZ60DRAFT_534816 [Tricladium varicosporioides]|nr:hypothetical protein BGZ60DRAFT_534816 [Hymenoscyphus varicosporioides]